MLLSNPSIAVCDSAVVRKCFHPHSIDGVTVTHCYAFTVHVGHHDYIRTLCIEESMCLFYSFIVSLI